MIFVMGATGQVGLKVVRHLLDNNRSVRCLARHFPNKNIFKGAELIAGDAADVSLLAQMMRGCSAVLTMIPENQNEQQIRYYQNKIGETIAEAIEETKVKKVVNLSCLGAGIKDASGWLTGLYDQECRLNEITHADIIHVRPAMYMENLLRSIPDIISSQQILTSLAANNPFSMIATQDVAARIAFLLMSPNFEGQVTEELLGERDISMQEVAQVLSQNLKIKNLDYFQLTDADMKRKLKKDGLSEAICEARLVYESAHNDGRIAACAQRTKHNTTSTSFELFVKTTFGDAYRNAIADEIKSKSVPVNKEKHP